MSSEEHNALSSTILPGGMDILIRACGCVDYLSTWQAMRNFTDMRTAHHKDEVWVCEHPPVFTLGLAGNAAHLLFSSDIPLVNTDRGGQITYHGPGQIVLYPLLELRRYGLKVREYVHLLEQSVMDALVDVGVAGAQRQPNAPGVYVPYQEGFAKIAALGIKVRKGCTYHGLALNVKMDLLPFQHINPCGYPGLKTVDLLTLGVKISFYDMQMCLVNKLIEHLRVAGAAVEK